MLKYFTKLFINTYVPRISPNTRDAVLYLYDKEVYPTYLVVKDNFKYAMQHKLLNRDNILEFKRMLNKSLFKRRHYNTYKGKEFSNDAHEIYSKLKCKYLSRKQLLKLNKYINKIVKSKQCTTCNSTNVKVTQP